MVSSSSALRFFLAQLCTRVRNFHSYTFTDFRDGALFGPEVRIQFLNLLYETNRTIICQGLQLDRPSTYSSCASSIPKLNYIGLYICFRWDTNTYLTISDKYSIPRLSCPLTTRCRYKLAHLFGKEGDKIGYLYDFGDKWYHVIEVSIKNSHCEH